MRLICAAVCFLLLCSCKNQRQEPALFHLVENSGIDFQNNVEDGRKDNSFLFRNFYNGGGVAIGDLDNDGLADVFLTSNAGNNKLYRNKGNFKFEDRTEKAGILEDDKWNTGVVFADVNGDGWLDIYVCSSGHMSTGNRKNKLYINNHDFTFTESAQKYGLDISAYTTQVSFFDYDMDGDLDCFMINNSPVSPSSLNFANQRDLPDDRWPVPSAMKGGGDHLLRNDNGHFVDVTAQAGIHGSLISFGLGVTVGDVNNDGYPDVYVSNDFFERDYLYINQKNGTFKDELENCMQHTSLASMGADIGDVNNDGKTDILILNVAGPPTLLINRSESAGHAVLFKLIGTRSNKAAIGARVTITAGRLKHIEEVRSGGSYLSQNDLRLHFGLGKETLISNVEISWPSGKKEEFEKLSADTIYTVVEDGGITQKMPLLGRTPAETKH